MQENLNPIYNAPMPGAHKTALDKPAIGSVCK